LVRLRTAILRLPPRRKQGDAAPGGGEPILVPARPRAK
jgi:hypothetical protein